MTTARGHAHTKRRQPITFRNRIRLDRVIGVPPNDGERHFADPCCY